jgi:signal transduction histidine kinase
VVARAEIGISRNRPFAVRAAVTVLLDVLIVLTAWLICRGLIGGGGGAVMGVFRRSYRRTVAATLAAFFLVPAVLFTLWSLLRLQQDSARERGAEVTRVLRNAVVRGELAQVTQADPDRAALELLADGVGADLAIYRRGRLVAASTPLLAELGLLAPVIDPALARTESNEASTNVAGLPGVNLRLGVEQTAAPGTVLAAVLPGAEAQLQREQVDIALLLLLASLGGGIAAVVVAGWVARALGQPIEALARTALAIGHREPLPDLGDPPAEFEPVFGAIAQMEGDLRESEAELEAGRSRTEAILSTVATGVIGVSADGTVMHVNPRAEALLGIAVAREQPLIAQLPAGWEAVGEGVHRLLGPHTRDAESRELEIGELRVAVTVAPLGDGGLVIAVTDITEASRAARILAWGEMARQVAHEIKNPLTPMRLGLQHLQRLRADGRPEFAEQVDQTASRLLVEIDRLDRIARAFARYGGPTTGDDGPLEPVNLETAVREVVELYALAAGEPRVELVGESATPCAVRREELIQVLLNLLDNARSADAESVRLVLAPLQLQVRDDGRGISAEQVGRIFEPTFSTTTRNDHGRERTGGGNHLHHHLRSGDRPNPGYPAGVALVNPTHADSRRMVRAGHSGRSSHYADPICSAGRRCVARGPSGRPGRRRGWWRTSGGRGRRRCQGWRLHGARAGRRSARQAVEAQRRVSCQGRQAGRGLQGRNQGTASMGRRHSCQRRHAGDALRSRCPGLARQAAQRTREVRQGAQGNADPGPGQTVR